MPFDRNQKQKQKQKTQRVECLDHGIRYDGVIEINSNLKTLKIEN